MPEHIALGVAVILFLIATAYAHTYRLHAHTMHGAVSSLVSENHSLQNSVEGKEIDLGVAIMSLEALQVRFDQLANENRYLASRVDFIGKINPLDVTRYTFARVEAGGMHMPEPIRISRVAIKPFEFCHTIELDDKAIHFSAPHIIRKMAAACARNIEQQIAESITASWVKAGRN